METITQQTDLEIARSAQSRPIADIAARLGIPAAALVPYGHDKAKLSLDFIRGLSPGNSGHLILVTALNPTPAGEGKTTVTVGLGDALTRSGHRTMICLREPSLGPCFGKKGGAAGGGYSQVIPMEDINLHFTGDFHAITSANNLLAAMIDNHIFWGNELGIDQILWRRALDLNDRALRSIEVSLGGERNGTPRPDGFDITVASEIMAILCLARDHDDLHRRLGRMVVAWDRAGKPVLARDLRADGAMTVLLKDALLPNLVQSLEGTPALIHGGPFANIAHGCNSLMATSLAQKLADFVVTEAGFGADLGAEKFFDIKCRIGGLRPSAVVLVATIRALKFHGGVGKKELGLVNPEAVEKGLENLRRHISNIRKFGFNPVLALNKFTEDSQEEIAVLQSATGELGVDLAVCTHWADGGQGAIDLASIVAAKCKSDQAKLKLLYQDDQTPFEKVTQIAKEIYGAQVVKLSAGAKAKMDRFEELNLNHLPVCIAKTQYSFSTDANLRGAPTGHELEVQDVVLAAGAGFFVFICGDIMRMPGLPRRPAAENISLTSDGLIVGLS